MSNYRRLWIPGGTYFFTVNLLRRKENDLLIRQIDLLRAVIKSVRHHHPFLIHAWVILPEHMHCVLSFPEGDADFEKRWRLIKGQFSKQLPAFEWRTEVQKRRNERGIWQRRYWEHAIRNEEDFCAHMDYVHINPLKHGLVTRVSDWPYSTFHHLVKMGIYPPDWAGENSVLPNYQD